MMARKKTPPEVFERQKQNIIRLRQLLERPLPQHERTRPEKARDEKTG
jgi:hypothetical protein